jgi:hypothetical protein
MTPDELLIAACTVVVSMIVSIGVNLFMRWRFRAPQTVGETMTSLVSGMPPGSFDSMKEIYDSFERPQLLPGRWVDTVSMTRPQPDKAIRWRDTICGEETSLPEGLGARRVFARVHGDSVRYRNLIGDENLMGPFSGRKTGYLINVYRKAWP